jgi:hypothetical protein
MKTILALFSFIFLLVSCEDIIEIDLDTIEPKLVIEGCINDLGDPCTIKLSKTGDYFEPGINPAVSGALVSLTDEYGIETAFEEVEQGLYTSESLEVFENRSYTLLVESEGEDYMAEGTIPQKVVIDSLSYEIPPLIYEFEEGYMLTCYLQDPGEYRNYYRLITYKTGDPKNSNDLKYIFNDDFMNGNKIFMSWDLEAFFPMDTVVVELQTLDKSTYDYYITLNSLAGGIVGASNPSNPETNLSNDALGYFGAYTVSRDTIVILPN